MERDSVVDEFEGDSSIANQGKSAGIMVFTIKMIMLLFALFRWTQNLLAEKRLFWIAGSGRLSMTTEACFYLPIHTSHLK